jgi:carboxypeptidase family protein
MKKLCPGILLLLLGALPLTAFQTPAARTPAKPRPSPTPVPVLEGTVKGPDGKPIEGALVIARSSVDYSDAALSTQTDATGRFRVTVKRPVAHTVRFEARGLAGRTVEKARPGTPLDVALAKGGVIEGTVRDGGSGQPVAQVRVQARAEMALSLPWEATAGVSETVTAGPPISTSSPARRSRGRSGDLAVLAWRERSYGPSPTRRRGARLSRRG